MKTTLICINFEKKFNNNNEHLEPVVIFNFIKDKNNMIFNIVFYSNQVGLIYDLILGLVMLVSIFNEFYGFVFVPKDKNDQDFLFNFIGDTPYNFLVDNILLKELFNLCIYENKYLKQFIQNDEYPKYMNIMIILIACYIPLTSFVADNLQLSPLNLKSESLPAFNEYDFTVGNFYYQMISDDSDDYFYCLYKKLFELYLIKHTNSNLNEEYEIEKQFYEKLYSKCDDSFILPCYGIFEKSTYFLFKFAVKKKNEFIHLSDTKKSELIFKLLGSVVTFQEFGFSHRAFSLQNLLWMIE